MGFDDDGLTSYSSRYSVIGCMHRQGLNYKQIGHITGHTTQVVECYIRQEELDNERYELLNEFQQFLRTGKIRNNPDRILKGINVGGGLDYASINDLRIESRDEYKEECYSDGTVITNPVRLRPSQLQQQQEQIDRQSIMDISRQIQSQQRPIPLPDFKTWAQQFKPTNRQNASNTMDYSRSKPTLSPSIPPTTSPTVPPKISTISPTQPVTSLAAPFKPKPRAAPTTLPRSASSAVPTRSFQAMSGGQNAARLRTEQKRESAYRRQQHVDNMVQRRMAEFKQKQKTRINQLISNHKQEINKLQSKLSELEKSKEAMQCAYIMKIADLEQQLEQCTCRNGNMGLNNAIEIDLKSGNKRKIIINISSE